MSDFKMPSDSGNNAQFANPGESATVSLWKHTAFEPVLGSTYPTDFPSMTGETVTDIAVVGAGITGVTTAILLQQAGYEVVLIDAHPVGYGVSGFNSGHLTSVLLDMKMRTVMANFGEEATRTVVRGVQESIDLIERMVMDFRIDCDFKRVPGYLYTENTERLKILHDEYEAAASAGLPVNRTFHVPLPFDVEEGVHVSDQARFHPLKYVQALALAFAKEGGTIFENTRVNDVDEESREATYCVRTDAGCLHANHVVIATHTPIGFRPGVQTRLEPWRSYIIGIRAAEKLGDEIFWDMEDPYHYIRSARDESGELIIIGGEDHKTGEQADTEQCFRNLERYARERFVVRSVDYRWSAQMYNPADGLPYIGELSGTYIATGYSGEGLTFGTLAASMITDAIVGIPHPCAEILSPRRGKPLATAGGFLAENMNVIKHFVKDRVVQPDLDDIGQVPVGEGRLCNLNGTRTAVYHAEDGVTHLMSPVCTHMGCIVGWNNAEKSWDCPCHGGRFDATGQVLNGPPVEDLTPMNIME